MEVEEKEKCCAWCGEPFQGETKKAIYCSEYCRRAAAKYQTRRGGKGEKGDAALKDAWNQEKAYYHAAEALVRAAPNVPIQTVLGQLAWDDLMTITPDRGEERAAIEVENAEPKNKYRLQQLREKMQEVMALPVGARKSKWPVELRLFLQAYVEKDLTYWGERPAALISFQD